MQSFQVETRNATDGRPHQLRKKGIVPMALVTREHSTLLIKAPTELARRAMSRADGHGRVHIQIAGEAEARTVIVQKIEVDALKQQLIHVAFQEVADDDMVKVDVPIVLIGENAAVELGAVLNHHTTSVKLRSKLSDMPDKIEVDASQLEIGQHLQASDLKLPAGVELLSPGDATLFTVSVPRGATVEEATENTSTEPEAEA